MTHTTTDKLIGQLRILHHLTNTEVADRPNPAGAGPQRCCAPTIHDERGQCARTRRLIAAALRERGGVPDVVTARWAALRPWPRR